MGKVGTTMNGWGWALALGLGLLAVGDLAAALHPALTEPDPEEGYNAL